MKKIKIQTNDKGQKFPSIVCTEPCPIERGMRILGGKWKASILWHLKDEPIRFNDLCRIMGGASKKMIDQRLKEMEKEGLVKRRVLSTRPIAVNYNITDFGLSAVVILEQISEWIESHNL
ncbi:helix-turn-helix transcriptional regulator [Mariprofundus ferrooxydans]|nr:helix-turn-helix transcriptional regulator [Mariprofundus ferrooxydans]